MAATTIPAVLEEVATEVIEAETEAAIEVEIEAAEIKEAEPIPDPEVAVKIILTQEGQDTPPHLLKPVATAIMSTRL